MANTKNVKGAGGIGQWDLQTATQDVRATTQPSPRGRRAPMNEGLNPNPVYSWKPLRTNKRNARKGRKTSRGRR